MNGFKLGEAKVAAFASSPAVQGMAGCFEASMHNAQGKRRLKASARAIGADHFNWYQVIVHDSEPAADWIGNKSSVPYIDPPAYGYGASKRRGDDEQWADRRPWYFDETLPPSDSHSKTGFKYGYEPSWAYLRCMMTKKRLYFQDEPAFTQKNKLKFHTWLVSVRKDGRLNDWHGGFIWESHSQKKGKGFIRGPWPLARNPRPEEYKHLVETAPASWLYEK